MPYFSVFAKARDPNVSSAQELHPEALSSSASANSLHPSRPASMSPSWRTKRWLHGEASSIRRHGSAGENVSPRKITENRIKKSKRKSFWDISIVNNLFAQWNVKQIDQGLDGDTLIKEELTQRALQDNDNTLINDEMDKQIDFRDSILKYNDPRIKDWSHDEVWVFNKLSKRGFEPLLSDEWKWDFPSFPDPLFSRDKKLVFINNLATTITDATNELNALVQAGPRCRDALLLKHQPEPPLRKGIERYMKWSLRDSKLIRKPHLDLIIVATAKPRESVQDLVQRISDKLYSLGREWRNRWRNPDCKEDDQHQTYTHDLPTLYGFIVKYSVVAVVTSDSRAPYKPIRTLVTLDFQLLGQDVWHALAISIICVKARNYILQLEQEGHIGEEVPDDSDPDA